MKYIFKSCLAVAMSVAVMASLTSCDDDDDVKEVDNPTLQLGSRTNSVDNLLPEDYTVSQSAGQSEVTNYFMYTNIEKWSIVAEDTIASGKTAEWFGIWPNEGKKDGRFYTQIQENKTLKKRAAQVKLIMSNGKVINLFMARQAAGAYKVWLAPGSKTITYEANKISFTIETNTNSSSYIKTSDALFENVVLEGNRVIFEIPENPTKGERKPTVVIGSTYVNDSGATVEVTATYTLTQKYKGQK